MNLGTSRHRKVSLVLSDGIASGRYRLGDSLPGEEALAKMFQVSRVTIRRALADLDAAGLIERKHGLGTFVKKKPDPRDASPMHRLVSQIAQAGKLAVEVTEFEYCVPPDGVRQLLKLKVGDEAQRVVRVRRNKHRPIMHLTTYVPGAIGRTYSRKDLERIPLYRLLARAGKVYRKAQEAVGACLADPIIAPLLEVEVGAALLFVQRILSTADDEPVEYLEVRASPDAYMLTRSWDSAAEPAGLDDRFNHYTNGL
ncbi:GntR family transcriptional regulator [Bradyrhizobium genosp. A]|uniref:GntR family transcriptional regulator n=1 Tax=Bradyrhizobium genosp. A TaxID=83626 RepID=UPI003CF656D0